MDLLKLKAHYCLMAAGTASFEIFFPTILRQIGYSTFTIGMMFTTLPIIATLSTVLVSGIADKFKLRRTIFLITLLLTIFSALLMKYLSERPLVRGNIHISCFQETVFSTCDTSISQNDLNVVLDSLPQNSSIRCEVECDSSTEFRQEICSSWLIDKFCVKENNSYQYEDKERIVFSGIIPVQKIHVGRNVFNENFDCLIGEIDTAQHDRKNKTYLPRCQRNTSATCDMKCDNDNFNNMINTFTSLFGYFQFWLTFFSMTMYFANVTICAVVTDTICYSLLRGRDDLYGKQRVLGALGFGVVAVAAGYLVDYSSDDSFKNYAPIWYLTAGLLILDFLCSLSIRVEQIPAPHSMTKDIRKLLIRVPAIIFAVWCFYLGFTSSLVRNFLYLHLEDLSSPSENSWIKTLQGTASLISSIPGEVPFFLLSGWIIKTFGHVHCMSFVLLVMSFRLLVYSILVRPIWVLPIELTHGVTYGLFYSVMTSYANLIALPGTETTSQGLFYSIFVFGQSCGSLGGGFVYEYYKGSIMFRIFGIITSVLLLLHIAIRQCARPIGQKTAEGQQFTLVPTSYVEEQTSKPT